MTSLGQTHVGKALIVLQLVQALAMGTLVYVVERSQIEAVWLLYGVAFGAWAMTLKLAEKKHLPWLIGSALIIAGMMLFAEPKLSDDITRFLWDAKVWGAGHHPFEMTPHNWVQIKGLENLPWRDAGLYKDLSSRDYFASYPPFIHLVLWVVGKVPLESTWAQMIALKLWSLLLVTLSILGLQRLLNQLGQPPKRVLWFALNPILAVELVGNLHWEAAMVCFMIAFLGAMHKEHPIRAGLWLAGAVSVKLVPLVVMPWVWKRLGFWRACVVGIVCGSVVVGAYLVMLPDHLAWANYMQGLSRFFDTFHFNGSLAYLLIWPLRAWTGDPHVALVGKSLAGLTCVVVCLMAWRLEWSFERGVLWAWGMFLLGSLVVHPWYLATPLMLASVTGTRAVLLWSALIQLTYWTYTQQPYEESLGLVAMEYLMVLGFLVWETRRES